MIAAMTAAMAAMTAAAQTRPSSSLAAVGVGPHPHAGNVSAGNTGWLMEFKAIALLNPSEVLEASLINMVELQVHVVVPPNLPSFNPSACVCGEDNVCVSQLH